MSPADPPLEGTEAEGSKGDSPVARPNQELTWGWRLLALTGLIFVLQGLTSAYRALASDAFEPGVAALDGLSAAGLASTSPELASYVSHLQANGGMLAALVGLAVLALAWFGIRRGQRWAWSTTVGLEVLYLAFLVPLHGISGFDYHTAQHLGPVAVGIVIVAAGALLAHRGLSRTATAPPAVREAR